MNNKKISDEELKDSSIFLKIAESPPWSRVATVCGLRLGGEKNKIPFWVHGGLSPSRG